jgi:hypothetical protein
MSILLVSEEQLILPLGAGRGMNSMFQDILKSINHTVIM